MIGGVDERVTGSWALSAGTPRRATPNALRCVPRPGPSLVQVVAGHSILDSLGLASDREAGRLRWEVRDCPPQLQGNVEGAKGTWDRAVNAPNNLLRSIPSFSIIYVRGN